MHECLTCADSTEDVKLLASDCEVFAMLVEQNGGPLLRVSALFVGFQEVKAVKGEGFNRVFSKVVKFLLVSKDTRSSKKMRLCMNSTKHSFWLKTSSRTRRAQSLLPWRMRRMARLSFTMDWVCRSVGASLLNLRWRRSLSLRRQLRTEGWQRLAMY